jgi:two-component system cell cycle sensor histidine kinase/response regulator CckA
VSRVTIAPLPSPPPVGKVGKVGKVELFAYANVCFRFRAIYRNGICLRFRNGAGSTSLAPRPPVIPRRGAWRRPPGIHSPAFLVVTSPERVVSRQLRLLLVEDSEDDALLVLRELRRGGYAPTWERVEDAAGMRAALMGRTWDAVISDWSMPSFSAPAALEILKESGLDLPFIIASGTIGEESAVAAMRAGAHDFVTKEKLARLVPTLERELRETDGRAARRRAERELQASEARYRVLFESSPLPMWVFATETLAFLAVNEAAIRHYGYTREEFAKLTIADLQLEDLGDRKDGAAGRSSTGGATWRHRKKNGETILVEIKAHDFEFSGKPARLILANDVSERLRLEEQLRQAQKMEAIGRLAGGIAHDFNNVLSVILSYGEILLADLKPGEPMRDDIEEIRKAGKRAAGRTRQIVLLSRQQVIDPKVLDLNEVLLSMDKMLQRIIGEDVELVSQAGQGLGRVRADPGSIEQVIMNLVVNARDAMPTGGRLTIETANVVLDGEYAREHMGVKPGHHVALAVSDTGIGMDRATQARIFEPFFTTKPQDKGTGLGLSTVFGIVQQGGGSVCVTSEPGTGTTFKIYLPRVDAAVDAAGPQAAPPTNRGAETILLVEDDDQVRAIARVILRKHGYEVIEARHAGEALLLCEQHPGTIHLLLSDVVMPQMSGPELAKRLANVRPEMKLICISGYTDDSVLRHGVLDVQIAYLQKPITPETLARKVREVLDSPKAKHLPRRRV